MPRPDLFGAESRTQDITAHGSNQEGRTGLVSPDGEVITAPNADVESLRAKGYTVATTEQVKGAMQAQQDSGYLASAAAWGSRHLSSATFGASDIVLPRLLGAAGAAMGGDYESEQAWARRRMREVVERNPGAGLLGTATGLLGPGAGRAMTSAGSAAERLVGGGVRGVFARGVTEGAVAGFGEGVSEAALDDRELNGERVAGTIARSVVGGGALGGGAAVGLHFGGKILSTGMRKAREAMSRGAEGGMPRFMVDTLSEIGSRTTGAPKEHIAELLSKKNAQRAVIEAPAIAEGATKDISERLTRIMDARRKLKPLHVGGEREATFHHMLSGQANDAQIAAAKGLRREYETLLKSTELDPATARITKSFRRDFEDELGQLSKQLDDAIASGNESAVNQAANYFKQAIGRAKNSADGALTSGGRKGFAWRPVAKQLDGLYETAKDLLENKSLWREAAEAQAAINKPLNQYLNVASDFDNLFTRQHDKDKFTKLFVGDTEKIGRFVDKLGREGGGLDRAVFDKGLSGMAESSEALGKFAHKAMDAEQRAAVQTIREETAAIRKQLSETTDTMRLVEMFRGVKDKSGQGGAAAGLLGGGLLGGAPGAIIGGVVGAVTNPARTISQLAAAQNLAGRMGDRMVVGVRGLLSSAKPGGLGHLAPKLTGALLPDKVSESLGLSEGYKARSEFARARQTSPEDAARQVSEAMTAEVPRLPRTTEAASAAVARQVGALQKAAPDIQSKYLLGGYPTPSPSERIRFERAKQMVVDYPAILEQVSRGTVSPGDAATMREVYPAEFADMQERLLDGIAEMRAKGKTLPYAQRRALGLLLDVPVEPLQDPELVQDIQASYVTEREQRKPPPPPPRDVRSKYATGSEQTAAELED